MLGVFLIALVLGAGALALWVDVRFPRLAPQGLRRRMAAAVVALLLLAVLPVWPTMLGLIGVFLPVLALALLTTIWLMRVAADPAAHV
jgi:hypothetical protein